MRRGRKMIPRTLFSEEHAIFRESVRRFIATEITPYHAQWEKDGVVPRALWRKAGAAGLLCTAVPAEYGGMGGDFLMSLVVLEELGLAAASGPFFTLHSDIVAPYLVKYGREGPKPPFPPAMARGPVIGAIALPDPPARPPPHTPPP